MCVPICAVQDSETETEGPTLQNVDAEGEWVPVCKPEEVPKGARYTLQSQTIVVCSHIGDHQRTDRAVHPIVMGNLPAAAGKGIPLIEASTFVDGFVVCRISL